MMRIRKFLLFLLAIGVILASCTPVGVTSPTPLVTQPGPPAQAETPVSATPGTETPGTGEKTVVSAAVAALMRELNIDANQVRIIGVEAVEWPNACLGAQKPDEMCAEVITPGYKITLQAGEKTYVFHTNQDGSQIRQVEGAAQGTAEAETPAAILPAAAGAAQQALARQLGIALERIQVVSVEPVEWPDGCLGIEQPGVMCTQAIVPGYRVVLEAGGKQYEFRTDESGGIVLPAVTPAAAPLPQVTGKVVVWEQNINNSCSRAEISQQSVAYGACGESLKEAPLQAERLKELEYFVSTYGQFSEVTGTGTLDFNGAGASDPGDAVIRSIAEWAALVYAEAQNGRVDESAALAFNWHREGGIAGFCDDMTVYRTGWALPRSCKSSQGQAAEAYRLSADELEKLYGWIDQLERFDYEHKDSAVSDAMLVRLSLVGSGRQQATPAQQEEIAGFAGLVYANAMNK